VASPAAGPRRRVACQPRTAASTRTMINQILDADNGLSNCA
jgi:hypothetical protein